MRSAERVARMGRQEIYTRFLSRNLLRRSHTEDLGIAGRIILNWISQKQGEKVWTGFIWLRIGTRDGLL